MQGKAGDVLPEIVNQVRRLWPFRKYQTWPCLEILPLGGYLLCYALPNGTLVGLELPQGLNSIADLCSAFIACNPGRINFQAFLLKKGEGVQYQHALERCACEGRFLVLTYFDLCFGCGYSVGYDKLGNEKGVELY